MFMSSLTPISSKPGAAAVAVLLSHEVVGLETGDKGGYANLLGTAMLTGIKVHLG